MRRFARTLLAATGLLLLPIAASAQDLSGTVTDSSGGVLPGVTVEARSAQVIGVRTAVTDGTGNYIVPGLPAATYNITFTLPGFSTVVRQGVVVSGVGIINIDAEMAVGALEETVTVTGETPIVDVASSRRGTVLDDDVVKSLPATRGYNAVLVAIPAITGGSQNVDLLPSMRIFYSHGGYGNEGRVQVDGLNIGAAFNGGGVSGYVSDTANAEELAFTLSGGLGEAEVGGTILNVIPKTGGNTFAGSAFTSYAGSWSTGDNLTQELRDFGIDEPQEVIQNWDVSGSLGGPFIRDRLWFFGTYRDFGAHQQVAGAYANQYASLPEGDLNRFQYLADPSVEIRGVHATIIKALRLTAQVHPLHKIGLYFDYQRNCTGTPDQPGDQGVCRERGSDWTGNGSLTSSPEASSGVLGLYGATGFQDTHAKVAQINYTSPLTNQLLLEAGYSSYFSRWGWMRPPGVSMTTPQTLRLSPEFKFVNALNQDISARNQNINWRASASYVTGSHNLKFGYQGGVDIADDTWLYNRTRLNYLVIVPAIALNSVTMRSGDWENSSRTKHSFFYVQDQWTRDKLTLQGALRYEHAWSYFPEGQGWPYGGDIYAPDPITFPFTVGVPGFNDIVARGGLAYDLFGDGKTAIKINYGQYLQAANNGNQFTVAGPAASYTRSVGRTWFDGDRDFVPDCNLLNSAPNGECLGWNDLGYLSPGSVDEVNPAILEGWGKRGADNQFSVAIQQEVLPRVSVELSYHRRTFHNFVVTDDRAVTSADYSPFQITAPNDPRLGENAGKTVTAYDINPDKFGVADDNYVTFEEDLGPTRTQYWHGFDVNINARTTFGLVFQGGTSTGRGVLDACASTTFDNPDPRFCSREEAWLTQFRGLASYVIPVIDVQVSSTMRSTPGTIGLATGVGGGFQSGGSSGGWLDANISVPSAVAEAGGLGRPLSSGGQTTVNLADPATLYGDRVTAFDVRVAKILELGGTRTNVGFDLYNLFNVAPGLSFNDNAGVAAVGNYTLANDFLRPETILLPRFIRFNITVDF